ncbi:glycosyltransferase [Flavobacterium ardleyense]|uniref:Glycosyltransferase n=1 Tax=Flavobacterium ardleyense TaxID=2038737 RepID=A0ABW5Z5G1_9FLAO
MRILLLGDYSKLHNSLKEGLIALGNEVILVSDGDDFKNYPCDYSIRPKFLQSFGVRKIKNLVFRITKFDICDLERGIRFYFLLKKLKGFDAVQLINERSIKTTVSFEQYLLKKIFENNNKVFLLSCGTDFVNTQFLLKNSLKYSVFTPYFNNETDLKCYSYMLYYVSKSHQKLHRFVYENCAGVIASDMDYHLPLLNYNSYLGLIANPINTDEISYCEPEINDKIIIFLGINRYSYIRKGIIFFEKALAVIKEKYADKIEIIITENIPYTEYIKLYSQAHILLDQVYAYDQGYNALEAMAHGKVVFTGAETEFLEHYNLSEDEVCINALPDENDIVAKLSLLIENPKKISEISKNARSFIEKEHDYKVIANTYLTTWFEK